MKISEEKKLEVLLSQLHERYEALHKMRDRSMQFVLWILGLGLGMSWLLIGETTLTIWQRLILATAIIVMGVVSWLFLSAIQQGFRVHRRIVIKLETALNLYQDNYYGIKDSILPQEFFHQNTRWTGHFFTLKGLILVVFLLLLFITWTNPCKRRSIGACVPSDPNQMQTQKIINE